MDNNLELLTILVADRQRAFFDYAENNRRVQGVRRHSLLRRLVHRARRRSGQPLTEVAIIDVVRREPLRDRPSNEERPHAA